jgi:hypothetical protein
MKLDWTGWTGYGNTMGNARSDDTRSLSPSRHQSSSILTNSKHSNIHYPQYRGQPSGDSVGWCQPAQAGR